MRCFVTDRLPLSALPWSNGKGRMLVDLVRIDNPRSQLIMEKDLNTKIVSAVQDQKLAHLFSEVTGYPLTPGQLPNELGPDDILLVGEYQGPPPPDPPAIPTGWITSWYLVTPDVLPETEKR